MKKTSVMLMFLFLMCGFCFAQNIKVIGGIPRTDTGKLYQLQIGAFQLTANANNALEILKRNGFVPLYEKRGDLIRVFVVANANEVQSAVDRLGRAGFREVIIREYPARPPSVVDVPDKTPYPDNAPAFDTEPPDHHLMHLLNG
jgi:hypothetical protein